MKRSISKPVQVAMKLGHGWRSQERCPSGQQNCSPTNRLYPGQRVALWLLFTVHKTKPCRRAFATKVMPQSRKRKNDALKLKKQKAASVCASSLLLVLYCFEGPTYDVTSHQFLLISLKMKNARPFSSSRFHNSLIPIYLPLVENSLCASSTSSGLATFRVKRLAADK